MSWSLHLPLNNAAPHRSLTSRPANYFAACLNVDTRAPDSDQAKPLKGKRSSEIISDEKKFIVGTYARAPVVLESGKGCKLCDVEGREYLDLTSGIAVNALGHGDSDWLRALSQQAEALAHVSNVYYSVPQTTTDPPPHKIYEQISWLELSLLQAVQEYSYKQVWSLYHGFLVCISECAENEANILADSDTMFLLAVCDFRLAFREASDDNVIHMRKLNVVKNVHVELAKRLVTSSFADRVFFCNSGTEANEAAIKFSRKFQRHTNPDKTDPPMEFIAFSNSFHGRTMGALALTSKEHYRTPFQPVMPGVTFLEYGDTQAAVEKIQSGKVAAVFVEPIQGEGGIYSSTKEFLQSLRTACDKTGCLLVFDEVQCGLGRTGYLWAHEAYNVYPDIMTLAKPLAGGLPIGAALVTERVAAAIEYGDHGSTFAGNPLVCSAAITVLDKISDPSFLGSVTEKGQYFKDLLVSSIGGNSHVKEVRGFGLIIGIDLDVSASPLVEACQQSGLLVLTAGKGNVVRIVPPLIISMEEVDKAVGILKKCFHVLDEATST
ncbi:hypothetical protein SASPL_124269 [Salvia splendens]|uniref:acetylornithine transaminase n=1 Tax=Salvia splendens TaxID=180675 RepID=A0A8X8XN68_SALSN|nr:hypothetical protein SASPL_124269 [Salvia splendens]